MILIDDSDSSKRGRLVFENFEHPFIVGLLRYYIRLFINNHVLLYSDEFSKQGYETSSFASIPIEK